MKWRHLPNILTAFRFLMVAPFLYFILEEKYTVAFFIFILASISDGLDGFLARRFQWQSKLGACSDPLADKLLVITTYATLAWNHQLPVWLAILMISRDIFIIGGAIVWYRLFQTINFKPTMISKANTVLQLILIIVVLYKLSFHHFFIDLNILTHILIVITTATTAISFVDYGVRWSIKAIQKKK